MAQDRNVTRPFRFHPALHAAEAQAVATITLNYQDHLQRNDEQARLLAPHRFAPSPDQGWLGGSNPFTEQCVLYRVRDAAGERVHLFAHDGEPMFQDVLYLFNVIVAVEWQPDLKTLQQLRTAFARASDFLYDVTNGSMAFGQVVIGGSDLLEGADIQIMASSRVHPRSWINALNVAEKFKPIRVGRGLWQKESETLLTWDTPEGYRTLVHEWGHYAFGLVDRHLDRLALSPGAPNSLKANEVVKPSATELASTTHIAAPQVALAVETLMATIKISELTPDEEIRNGVRARYSEVTGAILDGPAELPLPLPEVVVLNAPQMLLGAAEAASLDLEKLFDHICDLPTRLKNEGYALTEDDYVAHWLYLLKGQSDDGLPAQIVAQGKIGRTLSRATFALLGAESGDTVLVLSQLGEQVRVYQATLPFEPGALSCVTPPCFAGKTNEPLFVDVIPAARPPNSPGMQADIAVYVATADAPVAVGLYPSGSAKQATVWDREAQRTNAVPVPHLDGHVLLQWDNPEHPEQPRRFVCTYSQGGGPNTSGGGRVPITGGSADGNAMVFFTDNALPQAAAVANEGDQGVRVVTTTLVVGLQTLDTHEEARSYIFSIASNAPLGDYRPSLVLYYDRAALKPGGDLLIYRWNGGSWQPLRTLNRLKEPYLAIPLATAVAAPPNEQYAPNLALIAETAAPPARPERYRIFWKPNGEAGGGANATAS